MNFNYLLIGLAAFVGYSVLNKSQAADKLGFIVQKTGLRFEGLTPILDITIGIQNPTNETLTVRSVFGDVYINNIYVANVYSFSYVTIQRFGVTPLRISARLSLAGLFGEVKSIIQAITNGTFAAILNQTIKFKGMVHAEGVRLPLDFEYKVL